MSLVHEEIPLCLNVAWPRHVWNRSFCRNHPNRKWYETYPIVHSPPENFDLYDGNGENEKNKQTKNALNIQINVIQVENVE